MNRAMIKARARGVLMADYWRLVGLCLLAGLLSTGLIAVRSFFGVRLDINELSPSVLLDNMAQNSIISVATMLYTLFIGNVFGIGAARLSLSAYRGEGYSAGDLLFGFRNGRYWTVLGACLLRAVLVFIGFLLFFIPGIIISYGLSQVEYIIADENPKTRELSAPGILRASWEMMRGHKLELFVFELSFLGWLLLSALTLGILNVFYVAPYMFVSYAGYHDGISKDAYLRSEL